MITVPCLACSAHFCLLHGISQALSCLFIFNERSGRPWQQPILMLHKEPSGPAVSAPRGDTNKVNLALLRSTFVLGQSFTMSMFLSKFLTGRHNAKSKLELLTDAWTSIQKYYETSPGQQISPPPPYVSHIHTQQESSICHKIPSRMLSI